ncbi:MAG: beta-ketoacyl-ACP synthase III [Acidimicrobiales bacterium]|jgi:3-oxoacyl-[acyl-carrier-protein] synthase-3
MTSGRGRGSRVTGWASALPDKIVTNYDLEKTLDTTHDWIVERTGIHSRHIGGTTHSLSVESGQAAIARAGLTGDDIDMVVLATTTPDKQCPATASTVQDALGISGGAFDVQAACSGFVYGLALADGLIATGAEHVLVIGTDTLSNITDCDDRGTAILFADGSGSMVLSATEGPGNILATSLDSDGSLEKLLYAEHNGGNLIMNGREVFRKAVMVMVSTSNDAMSKAGVTIDDISLVVPHQANIRIIEAACKRLHVPMDQVAVCLDHTGNTSSASIPLAFVEAEAAGRIKPGELVLMTGFGAGMSSASAVLRWGP